MTRHPLASIRPVSRQELAKTINEFQSDATEIQNAPDPLTARMILFALGAFVVIAIIWASLATIDRVVTARGRLVANAQTVVVQAFEPSIIKTIEVKAGDVVKAGAVLATLDPTFTTSDIDQIQAKLESLDAVIRRLEVEQNHQEKSPFSAHPTGYAALQEAAWRERQVSYNAQLRVYEERIARIQADIAARTSEREHLQARLGILKEVEAMRVALETTKSGSRLNSLLARDSRIDVERNLHIAESTIVADRHEIEALESERDVFRRQWVGKVLEDLVTKRGERDALEEQLIKAKRRHDMIKLQTPVDGVVLEIASRSVGSIVNSAEPFFTLVPLNAELQVEADIEASQLGYIAVGDPVEIKLDAFPYLEHGVIAGRVKIISGDAFTASRNNPEAPKGAFYKAIVELGALDLRNIPDTFRLIPGIPLTAEIKVGHRSVIGYLLRPILRGLNESMREP